MLRSLHTVALFLVIWKYHSVNGEDDKFSEIMSNPLDQPYFNKYGPCSVSMNRLNDAYLVEGDLIDAINQAFDLMKYRKSDKESAKDYEQQDEEIKKQISLLSASRQKENGTDTPTDHLINALHFLRRTVLHFNPIFNKIFTSKIMIKRALYQDLSSAFDRLIREHCSCWPTSSDLQTAISGIVRAIKTYQLSKEDLINGDIFGHRSIEPLQMDEIVILIQEANRQNYFSDVLQWTELILKDSKIHVHEGQLKNMVRLRAAALFKTGLKSDAIQYLEKTIKENKFDTKLISRDLKYYQTHTETVPAPCDRLVDHSDLLCRADNNISTKNNLRCFYRKNAKGWDRSKVELLNVNPPIYKYYGVVKNEDINDILKLVKTTKTQQHLYKQKGEIKTDSIHSKEETVFWDEDQCIMKKLSRKVSFITGLETNNHKYNTKLSSSGPFNIINYGIGGFEDSQVDYLRKADNIPNRDVSVFGGDRIATWTYQLSGGFEGGRIIFPKVNVSIPLEQGTGLIWFNIMKNGTANPLSEHMECPIAHGSKWQLRKYIHENGNMFTRQCLRRNPSLF